MKKKLILSCFIVFWLTNLFSQYTIETFNEEGILIEYYKDPGGITYTVDTRNTETLEDDILYCYEYDFNHHLTYVLKLNILTITPLETSSEWLVSLENNMQFTITFWNKNLGPPLVAYTYEDGYTLYSGNLNY